VDDLYRPEGRYRFSGGYNVPALLAVLLAVLPVIPGFLNAATTEGGIVADPTFLDELYRYGIFVTFGIAAVAYLVLGRLGVGAPATQRVSRATVE
jgi:NCS1 family nucleobase:cation symporter-1